MATINSINGKPLESAGTLPLTKNTTQSVTAITTTVIDVSAGNIINLAHDVDIDSLSFSNVPDVGEWIINKPAGASAVIVWDAAIKWADGITPSFAAADVLAFKFIKTEAAGQISATIYFDRAPVDSGEIAVAENLSPYIGRWKYTVAQSKFADPSSIPITNASAIAYSADGVYLALGVDGGGDLFDVYTTVDMIKLADFATMPAGAVSGIDFSPDGNYMAVANVAGTGFIIYNVGTWTVATTLSGIVSGTSQEVRFSHDSAHLIVTMTGSPYFKVIETAGWTALSNPASLPDNTCYDASWKNDNSEIILASTNTPYILIYTLSGSILTKVADPSVLPTGSAKAADYSLDGSLAVIGHQVSPYITIYDTSDWSKITNPSLPSGTVFAVRFNPSGTKLAVGFTIGTDSLYMYTVSGWTKDTQLPSDPASTVNDLSFRPLD